MYPVYFKITFWDDIDNKEKTETGFFYADNYKKAAEWLTKYYGEDSINSMFISLLDEGPILVPELIAEKIMKEHF